MSRALLLQSNHTHRIQIARRQGKRMRSPTEDATYTLVRELLDHEEAAFTLCSIVKQQRGEYCIVPGPIRAEIRTYVRHMKLNDH